MREDWSMRLMMFFLTPRKVAWVLVLGGAACFIYYSPKTPIEFFDAREIDRAAIQELKDARRRTIHPAVAAASRKLDELMSYSRQCDRIALLYDLANNPQRVNSSEVWIVDGFYSAEEDTVAALRANDESYRAAEREEERCRQELHSDRFRREPGDTKETPTAEDTVVDVAIFRMELETSLLREFQARLFWRKAR
jgi:hypothetical protein